MSAPQGQDLLAAVDRRLRRGQRVRRRLDGGGRLHIDRQVPFLCVHRGPSGGAAALVETQASYLLAPVEDPLLPELVEIIARALAAAAGGFLLLEVWAGEPAPPTDAGPHLLQPGFRLAGPTGGELPATVAAFGEELGACRVGRLEPRVERLEGPPAPAGRSPLLRCPIEGVRCYGLGLEVEPVWRSTREEATYPAVLQSLAEQLVPALQKSFLAFAREATGVDPGDYRAFGRRTLGGAAWHVDRRLQEVSEAFDFLLLASPVNSAEAWEEFRASGFERAPRFFYRPLPLDPQLAKRDLFAIPIERVEDPVLGHLFRDKQEELDRQITMLADRGTPRFLPGSLQLYGPVSDDEQVAAERLLERLGPPAAAEIADERVLPDEMARRAREEIAHYRRRWSPFAGRVEVRSDVPAGLLVSRGCLYVGATSRFPASRVAALLHHEVGTHLLTYFNGKSQRIRLFSSGLAGYEALQEGLAVLAEHLVGGLTAARLRVLAARVVACRMLTDGDTFVDVWRRLTAEVGLEKRTAFGLVSRVWRGGGLTKDAIYLRGLRQLLAHLRDGGELEPLFVGKIACHHVGLVVELTWRNFFRPPPLRPRFLDEPGAAERLAGLQRGERLLAQIGETPG